MKRLILFLDLVLINASLILAFYIRFGDFPRHNFVSYQRIWPLITIIYLFVFMAHRLYDSEEDFSSLEIGFQAASSSLIGFLFLTTLAFFARTFSFPRTVMLIAAFNNFVFISLHHIIWNQKLKSSFQRIILIGNSRELSILERDIGKYSRYRITGSFYAQEQGADYQVSDADWDFIQGMAEQGEFDQAIVNAEDFSKPGFIEKVDFLLEKEKKVLVLPGMYEIFLGGMQIKEVAGFPCRELTYIPSPWLLLVKRMIDVVSSLVGLLLFAPFFPIVALMIKLDSRGPVFFVQERVGYRARKFMLFKFRTMKTDAEAESGPVWASQDDPRVTRVGRMLRDYRIDELPQLYNVLKGEMSLVGPRPEREFFIEQFTREYPFFRKRLKVKPGLTGLAQIHGRYETDPNTKLKYDLMYIQNLSLFLDMEIIFLTLRVILKGKGS